ncbi:T9SS type A sorting domain-containing protein [Saccharicrinis sp. FJH62]|uniref:T9SS type A sorting domain-containing protein n=1 Tax=Saccharicrinis sp. FJH62 TaxID=3344657 RepID=UPI0035D4E9AB
MTKKYKLLFLITAISFNINLYCQNYRSIFGTDSTRWNISHSIPDAIFTDQLIAFGDTTIEEKIYKKLFIDNYSQGFLREDTISGKIWYLSWNGSEYLVMDLDKEKGDHFDLISYYDTVQIQIDSVFYNEGRKNLITNYYLDEYDYEKLRFIEGIGPNNGFFLASHSETPPSGSYLLCSYKDSDLEYSNVFFDGNCYLNWTNIQINEMDKTKANVFPNPVSSEVSFEINSPTPSEYNITILNINGKTLITETFSEKITLNVNNFTSGIYFYKINDSKSIIQTGKLMIK